MRKVNRFQYIIPAPPPKKKTKRKKKKKKKKHTTKQNKPTAISDRFTRFTSIGGT